MFHLMMSGSLLPVCDSMPACQVAKLPSCNQLLKALYPLSTMQDLGWHWQHAALFASMVASTDAVAVSAILHSGGGRPCIFHADAA